MTEYASRPYLDEMVAGGFALKRRGVSLEEVVQTFRLTVTAHGEGEPTVFVKERKGFGNLVSLLRNMVRRLVLLLNNAMDQTKHIP